MCLGPAKFDGGPHVQCQEVLGEAGDASHTSQACLEEDVFDKTDQLSVGSNHLCTISDEFTLDQL